MLPLLNPLVTSTASQPTTLAHGSAGAKAARANPPAEALRQAARFDANGPNAVTTPR